MSCGLPNSWRREGDGMLLGDDRPRLTSELTGALRGDRPASKFDEVGFVEHTRHALVRYGALAAERSDHLGARQREWRRHITSGEIVPQHLDNERDVAAALTRFDKTQCVDARELALGTGEGIRDRDRFAALAAPPPPPEEEQDDGRGGDRQPEPPRDHVELVERARRF